ncbi:YCF48-related protein [Parvibaculum sp.]|uniref:WD40/YVTN/BNR-like repeat-containing protein n=1 Tax=Parvibaculum sp. TaxID=2024848 RepID=UPI002731E8B6|nr:YCF48-related protein [Parvibaculum sp.]MDP1627379.1 YCF48-related protein [Parvibaculum sp.]MDP2148558.1 YCF48-related protein [Parvibaculum sp.]MDP3327515.1 YCF48-related protein [Parvibaculum sp.]
MAAENATLRGRAQGSKVGLLRRGLSAVSIVFPVLVISGLFYAAFFVKPVARIVVTPTPVIETRDLFYSTVAAGDGVLWAAGSHGKIIRSEDAGASWRAQASNVNVHLKGLAAWDEKMAIAVGNEYTIVRTVDGGHTWEKVALPDNMLDVKLLKARTGNKPGNGVAIGEFGTVLATSDFGQTWTLASTGADVSWNDAAMLSESKWVLVGEFGQILRTENAGESWEKLESPVESSLNAVYFRDTENGVTVGTEGVILVTNDSGRTWRATTGVNRTHIYDVAWDGRRWIAVGDRGLLLTAETSGLRWNDKSMATSAGWRSHIAFDGGRYVLSGRGIELADIPSETTNVGAKR